MISTGGDFEMPMVEQPLDSPSCLGIAAIAAARELVHDVVAPARRDRGRRGAKLPLVPAGAAVTRSGSACDEGGEHRLGDALRHLGRAARDRPRILRVEKRAFAAA